MAERRAISFSLANLFLVVTWVSIVLGIQATWGRQTLPYTIAISGGIVGILIGRILIAKEGPRDTHWLRHPRWVGSCLACGTIGSFLGRALQYAGGSHSSNVFAAIQLLIAAGGVLGILLGIRLRSSVVDGADQKGAARRDP